MKKDLVIGERVIYVGDKRGFKVWGDQGFEISSFAINVDSLRVEAYVICPVSLIVAGEKTVPVSFVVTEDELEENFRVINPEQGCCGELEKIEINRKEPIITEQMDDVIKSYFMK